jgi:hypothetical protein
MSIRILHGDVREQLTKLPSDSFDCIVTSPPYWGLRDYGTAKWEGGSADCDHAISRGDPAAKSTLVGSKTNCGSAPGGFKTRCGRCGASRIDNQIGLETTLTEYDRLGRGATLIELNPNYVSLIKNRIADDAGMFAQVAAE